MANIILKPNPFSSYFRIPAIQGRAEESFTWDDLEDIEEPCSPLGRDFDPSGYTDYPTEEDLQEYGCISNQEQ